MATNTWNLRHLLWISVLTVSFTIQGGIDVFDWGHNCGMGACRGSFVNARNLDLARSDLEGTSLLTETTSDVQSLRDFQEGITSDPSNALTSWTAGAVPPCSWRGVNCSGSPGKIQGINLSGLQLGGSIDLTHLASLPDLLTIDLSYNDFSGEVRVSNLTSLTELRLGFNDLMGNIPASLRDSLNLRLLSLATNRFTGPIPQELGSLQKLEEVDLIGNMLTGSMPGALSNCSSLKRLYLDQNLFAGEIEPEIGHLSSLEYFSATQNSLNGSIPASLANCSSLISIMLDNNSLTGRILSELGSLNSLEYLSLSENSLSGELPGSLMNSSLTGLIILDLGKNMLTGTIPSQMGQLQKLRYLGLQSNNFNDSIPQALGQLGSLITLFLGSNNFSGPIPSALMNCSLLEQLAVDNNFLTGELLPGIGELPLEHFWANDNLLSGAIPNSLANSSSLTALYLGNNNFQGSIPQNFGRMSRMQYLYLEGNALGGQIPAGIFAATVLNLGRNQLNGSIPPELRQLQGLITLDLHANNLSGPIPGTLSEIYTLQNLDLSDNQLTGEIPSSLTSLTALTYFDVSHNNLTGPVPEDGRFGNFSAGSYDSNPDLCGQQLPRKCGGGGSHRNLIWIVVVAAVGGLAGSCFFIVTCLWCCVSRRGSGEASKRELVKVGPPVTILTSQTDFKELGPGAAVAATNGFSDTNILGVGSRSTVFLGILPGGATVAVKRLKLADSENVVLHLRNELQRVLPLDHPNLLKVYGLLSTPELQALILEYMPQGSLKKQLYQPETCSLTWPQRLNIALGVAEGMVHLHNSKSKPVLHLDLKPSNILLDDCMHPKVSDYAIAQFLNHQPHADFSISSNVYGTIGYIPPEYGAMAGVSTKGDVYNFGKVLMELLTRKQPTDDMFEHELSLRSWVMDAYPDRIPEVLDSSIEIRNDSERVGVQLMFQLAISCTRSNPKERPEMLKVRNMLLQITAFQAPQKTFEKPADAQQEVRDQSETDIKSETDTG